MTAQELFDFIVGALLKQGKPSLLSADRFSCAYRGVDNTKCAVGHIIPDDKYEACMEGKLVGSFIYEDWFQEYDDHYLILRKLQSAHDQSAKDYIQNTFGCHYKWPDLFAERARSITINSQLVWNF